MRHLVIKTLRDYVLQAPDYLKEAITENRGVTVEDLVKELNKIEIHNCKRTVRERKNRREGKWNYKKKESP